MAKKTSKKSSTNRAVGKSADSKANTGTTRKKRGKQVPVNIVPMGKLDFITISAEELGSLEKGEPATALSTIAFTLAGICVSSFLALFSIASNTPAWTGHAIAFGVTLTGAVICAIMTRVYTKPNNSTCASIRLRFNNHESKRCEETEPEVKE